jgi:uncharacterized Tic20 family protein
MITPNQNKEENNWAMACQLASFAGYMIPLGNVIGPLIVWLIKRQEMPFVNEVGKEAVNFQISLSIYCIISIILCFVLIGFVLLIGLAILNLIVVVIASIKANEGIYYRYPLTIRFIK